MSIFLLKLAVAVIPLLFLVVSVTLFSSFARFLNRHPLTLRRIHKDALRPLAHGPILR